MLQFSIKINKQSIPMGNYSEARGAALQDMMMESSDIILLTGDSNDITKAVQLCGVCRPEIIIHN